MKFSVLHTKNAQYQFAVTVDGVHRSVEGLPTLTEAMHLTLAELKTRTASATTSISGELAPPIAAEIELWGAGVTYLRSRDARKEEMHLLVFAMTVMHQFLNQKLLSI
ncbi:MAG: hypothetical protein NTW39_02975 [Actinobacteria bacterium]|nr:hypothetical protein [Actinomycetota bacterium]